MMNDHLNRRSVALAAIMASFLMLVFGTAYRALAARLSAPITITPMDPSMLERFPMQIGDWIGKDVPLDDHVVRRTATDVHISRRYSHRNGFGSVSLYIGCGVRVDEITNHNPVACYGAAGWRLVDRRSVELAPNHGMKLPCSVLLFSRGGWEKERVAVLQYYIVDGQYFSDVSLIQSRVWRIFAVADYVTTVQIVASAETATADSATELITAFANDSASFVARPFEDLERDRP